MFRRKMLMLNLEPKICYPHFFIIFIVNVIVLEPNTRGVLYSFNYQINNINLKCLTLDF